MPTLKKTAFQTLKLPSDVTKSYVQSAIEEQKNDIGMYGHKHLSELTGIGDSRIKNAAIGRNRLTMEEMDKISVFSKFNLFEVENDLAEKHPLIFKELKK